MECRACGAAVAEGSKFCSQCGTRLLQRCPGCGHDNPPGAKFCSECGTRLDGEKAQTPAPAPRTESPMSPAERRPLTVMFCDLVGSTALSTRLDPEDMREILGVYQTRVIQVVKRFDGFVARHIGDGVLVYFGYPSAHEDDAERAVRAGLALLQEIGQLPAPERLRIRIGVATGLVVVGDILTNGSAPEHEVVGEVPNLAARLQALAEPDAIVIADRTYRQVGSLFDVEDLGPRTMKGFAGPQRAWRVLGESRIRSRFEALHSASLMPLVGREEEFELLMRRWGQAKQGEGRVVVLSADPGVGKSRLVAELTARLQAEPHLRMRYFCSPYTQESALFPIISQLERAAGFERNDMPGTKLEKLDALLARAGLPAEHAAFLAELLSIPASDRASTVKLAPQAKKEKTYEALLRLVAAWSRQRPILMVLEDMHWIDQTSHELFDRMVRQIAALPVLLVVTLRTGFQPAWSDLSHVTTVALTRLGQQDGAALVRRLAGEGTALPDEILDEIVERAEGVPLFLEEVTKAILETTGVDAAHMRAALASISGRGTVVPPILQTSLLARLDGLGLAAKEVAQVGAAIGREFSFELLTAVAQRPEPELRRALGQLVEAGLLVQRGTPPRADYSFKHALVQEAAYSTLLRGSRQALHARVTQALESTFADTAENRPELVAYHLTEAGVRDRAAVYWQRAGELALRRSATAEAIKHFSHALQVLEHLPESPERVGRELAVRLGLGTALSVALGSSQPEVAEQYARALELGRRVGDGSALFRALWGNWYTAILTGQSPRALALADELVGLAERLGDENLVLEAYHSRWATSHPMGLNAATLADTERGIALYDPARHHAHVYEYGGHDTGVCAHAQNAMTLWITGFADKAVRMSAAALELGRRLEHPPSLGHAAWWSAALRQVLGEPAQCRELAELGMQIARDQKSRVFVVAPLLLGWAAFQAGDVAEGLRIMEQQITTRQSDRRFYYDYELLVFAEALLTSGAQERALAYADKAIRLIEETGNCVFLAEGYRLKGLCLAASGGERTAEAEAWLAKAIETAERQGALALRLRAATALAQIRRDQGRRAEARDLLAPVYEQFTEGFGTRDLVSAKSLLDSLAGEAP